MTIQIVVIADENNAIGKNNQLLCYLPADLKHFKELTINHPVIMGRKTFESLDKPLNKRRNIIVTTQNMDIEGCEVVHSIEEGIELCKNDEIVSIVGGGNIYSQSMDLADVIYLTRIHHSFDADAYFPEIDEQKWIATETEYHQPDEKNLYPFTFITMKKR